MLAPDEAIPKGCRQTNISEEKNKLTHVLPFFQCYENNVHVVTLLITVKLMAFNF